MCLFSTAGCLWSVRTMRSSEPSSSWRTNCLSSDSSRGTRTRRTSGRTSRLLTLSSQHRTENLLVGWSWTVKQHEEGEFTCPRHLKHSDRITRHPQQQQMFCFLECLFSFSCRLVVEDAVVYTDVQFDLLHSFVKDCCFCWFKLSRFFGLLFFYTLIVSHTWLCSPDGSWSSLDNSSLTTWCLTFRNDWAADISYFYIHCSAWHIFEMPIVQSLV